MLASILFIGSFVLSCILLPICFLIAIEELTSPLAACLIMAIPFIPVGVFFLVYIYNKLKKFNSGQ